MTRGDKVYVVENYLVEELTAALVAGEAGLTVTFGCQVDSARVHVTDQDGTFWEIPTTAVCTVPEGHLSNLYDGACPAYQLHLAPVESARMAAEAAGLAYRKKEPQSAKASA